MPCSSRPHFNITIFFAGGSYCNKRRSEYFKDWWNWQSSDNVWTTWGEDCTHNISILINMSYKHSEVSLSTFWSFFSNLRLFSKIVRQDSFGIGLNMILLYIEVVNLLNYTFHDCIRLVFIMLAFFRAFLFCYEKMKTNLTSFLKYHCTKAYLLHAQLL